MGRAYEFQGYLQIEWDSRNGSTGQDKDVQTTYKWHRLIHVPSVIETQSNGLVKEHEK